MKLYETSLSPSKRRLQGGPYSGLPVPEGAYRKAEEGLFIRTCSDRTRRNGFKFKEAIFRLDIRKKFFTVRVVRHWNRLPVRLWMPLPRSIQGQVVWGSRSLTDLLPFSEHPPEPQCLVLSGPKLNMAVEVWPHQS